MNRIMRAIYKRFKQALKGLKGLRYPPERLRQSPDNFLESTDRLRRPPKGSWNMPKEF